MHRFPQGWPWVQTGAAAAPGTCDWQPGQPGSKAEADDAKAIAKAATIRLRIGASFEGRRLV
jgi:hypothetical protein